MTIDLQRHLFSRSGRASSGGKKYHRKAHAMRGTKIEIKVTGPFRVRKSTGEDCTPRGRKACALLAMLALSPDNKRSRVWIQDKLWGSRGKEQAAASLRQSLFEIRKAFGDEHECIVSDNFNVLLNPDLVETDLGRGLPAQVHGAPELLEGFDIGEEGFEDWLRNERVKLRDRPTKVADEPRAVEGPARKGDANPHCQRRTILLVRDAQQGTSILADSLVDSIAKTITELAAATIIDRRADPRGGVDTPATLSLRSDVVESDAKRVIRLVLLQAPTNTLAWSSTIQLDGQGEPDLHSPSVMRCINLAVNVAIDQFAKLPSQSSERAVSSALCHSGILHLFRLGKMNFKTADQLFAAAFEIEPRGIYLAWRAYLRTFLLAERQYSCRQTIEAEAFEFVQRALELEPHNSYVAGLSAHVHAMMRRSYVAAYELAERSVSLNHANPIGWACLGIAESYLGKPDLGFRHTILARTIAEASPLRYQLDALGCIAGTMAGELDKATYLAEASHAFAPAFAPPLRYLSALYAHEGRHDRSLEMVQKLQINEPDFCYDMLRDKGYPAAGLHRTSIIESLPKRQV